MNRTIVHLLGASLVLALLGMGAEPPAATPANPPAEKQEKKIADGRKAPKFSLEDTTGAKHALEDCAGKTLVLVWVNPMCPATARVFRDGQVREFIEQLEDLRKNNDTIWLGVCSNADASAKQCEAFAREHRIDLPILLDSDGEFGKKIEAKKTPQVFVIDGDGVIRYEGALDDDPTGTKKQSGHEVLNFPLQAVKAIREGRDVAPKAVEPYGLPIRYPTLDR